MSTWRSTGTLDRMLRRLPEYLDRTPAAVPALQLAPDAPITVTIAQHRLQTRVSGPGMVAVDIDLLPHTLQSLVDHLHTFPGYGAGLLGVEPDISAATLIDVSEVPISAVGHLDRFTSTLWALLSPIAWEVDRLHDNVRAGLLEFSVRTADGLWLDRWGTEFYGGLVRLAGESDAVYATRIIREVTRWRVNGVAMEQIIQEDLGLQAVISTLHDRAWVVGRTGRNNGLLGYGHLAGRKYSRTTFEVVVDGVSDQVARLIERNRAAGTYPWYAFRLVGGGDTISAAGAAGVRRSRPFIGGDTVWTIGRDPLGRSSIMLSGLVEVAFTLGKEMAEDSIFGSGGATAFVLGASLLGGPDVLGVTGATGMAIVEDYSECELI